MNASHANPNSDLAYSELLRRSHPDHGYMAECPACQTMTTSFAAGVSGMFRHLGPKPISVKATGRRGYVARFASRADALEAGGLVLGSFAGDPESGNPTVSVLVKADGSALLTLVSDPA